MSVDLTEALLSQAAGWEAMKQARAYLEQGQVLSSFWAPPLLRGVVQSSGNSFRASMVIKNSVDIENLCTCRDSREWGKICAHSVAVGLHFIRGDQPAPAAPKQNSGTRPSPAATPSAASRPPALRRDADGDSVELFVVLPPNLEQALERGKIMLSVEARWNGRRVPLNALPKSNGYAFGEKDAGLLGALEQLTNGEAPGFLQVGTDHFASILPAMLDHPNITLGKATPVRIINKPVAFPFKATLEANGEIEIAPLGSGNAFVSVGSWVWNRGTFQPLMLPPLLQKALTQPVRISRAQIPQFLNQHWPQLEKAGAAANFKLEDFALEPHPPRFLLELKGGLAQLSALLQCRYGSRIMTLGVTAGDEGVWMPDPESPTRYWTRDVSGERAAIGRLQRHGFSAPDTQGRMQLNGQNAVLNFFAREYPRLQKEWTVTLEERLERSTQQNIERIEPQFQVTSSGVQWFDLGVVFESSGGERFSAADVQRLLLSGQSHTRLKNGKMAVIDTGAVEELQEVLLDCAPQQHAQGYRINNTQAGFLESTLRQHADWKFQAPAGWRDRAAKQSGDAKLECPPLGTLEDILRPYQKHGVAWLHFLRENGFGGILADEMGLGKTLQALAFLRTLNIANAAEARRPHLIVCPTSLVFNWLAEAARFTPDLKVLALHGPDRHRHFAHAAQHDIVITSYALIRRDAERYRELEFDTVVLDEAQHIKNRETQNAQAVKAVRSQHRLVLTGTPLENSVADLWSIFDFLMPGYLGTARDFRDRYEVPIAREKSAEAQARLGRRLRPFLLRRLKKDVVAELPAKLEQVSFCELTRDQRAVYQQLLDSTRREVLDAAGKDGVARSRMIVLNALLRLRQVCCDLRLLKLEDVDPKNASGKLELFSELLQEVVDGGHRVLVFSQFVSMLALLKERLAEEGVEFCYLDGSTIDRGAVVDRFQKDSKIPVFLISLKAGGVGLNLTGADTVIHFDPWWNPAVEDQATDRAHRIGQTRVVTSYKLIARDTVEEKIVHLQNRKREVIKATLGGEDEFSASLSWDEIQELLA
ncbi:MAG TPA: SNF2-related protein [Verrucomicrobiae bacterium]|nr:SNF2-related protein [Verrucomicrobiae bacterium]